jgi:hypothetical protein
MRIYNAIPASSMVIGRGDVVIWQVDLAWITYTLRLLAH